MPRTVPSSPRGSAVSGSAAAGSVTASGEAPRPSAWPMVLPAAATTPRPAAAASTWRRSLRPSRWAVLSAPAPASGSRSAAPSRSSRPRNQLARNTPATAVTKPGSTATEVLAGRSTAANTDVMASAPSRARPRVRWLRATKPMPPAMSRVPIPTDPMRIGLSAVPNCATAHSLTGVGVRSMTVEPTASTGEDSGETKPATRCPRPAPAAALSTVPRAYHHPRGRRGAAVGGMVVMQQVRSGGPRRMSSRPQCARTGARRAAPAHVPLEA